jgi:hypothetical protein
MLHMPCVLLLLTLLLLWRPGLSNTWGVAKALIVDGGASHMYPALQSNALLGILYTTPIQALTIHDH